MGVLDVTPQAVGQNPGAHAVLSWGREGAPAGFQVDTEGDATLIGTVTIADLVVTGSAVGPFPGGGGVAVSSGYITSGNITAGADASWTPIGATSVLIPAAVGDVITFIPSFMIQPAGGAYYDLAVRAGGVLVRYASSGTGTAAIEGDPGLYPGLTGFRTTNGGTFTFTVGAGDLTGGNVEIVAAHLGSAASVLYASTNYPYRWVAYNFGA